MFSVHLYFGNPIYTLALPDVLGSVSSSVPITPTTPTSYEYLSHFISHTEQGPSGWTFGLGQPIIIISDQRYQTTSIDYLHTYSVACILLDSAIFYV